MEKGVHQCDRKTLWSIRRWEPLFTVSLQNGIFLCGENSGVHIAEENFGAYLHALLPGGQIPEPETAAAADLGCISPRTILDHHGIQHSMVNTENGVKFTAFLW